MLELWQTEWCPASRRVRERLTELGIDYVTRQVPVEREERTDLRQADGADSIPALVLRGRCGGRRRGRDPPYLDDHFEEPPGAEAHRSEGDQGAPPRPGGGSTMLGTSYTLSETTTLPLADAVERVARS